MAEANRRLLEKIYSVLRKRFGHQHWWPGESAFEVIVGAILTQNTSWKNVEKAIRNLKTANVLHPHALNKISEGRLAQLIRPAGYYNMKARRLKNFLAFLFDAHHGSLKKLFSQPGARIREQLLDVSGIGPETADSILLYAGGKPFFVVDAYTKRILARHHFLNGRATYGEVQDFFTFRLSRKTALFNDYHAQMVQVGKNYCARRRPKCDACPLSFLFEL